MKNIHILPTDKPSRIYMNLGQLFLEQEYSTSKGESLNQNIYITSDEPAYPYALHLKNKEILKIKGVGEKSGELFHEKGFSNSSDCEKIILTDNKDLIKDGVQAIDDEFLEWFFKNRSCEEVEVNNMCYGALGGFADAGYKIIIPKEIDMLELGQIIPKEEPLYDYGWCKGNVVLPKEEPKQERVCNCGLKESEHNVRHPFKPKQEFGKHFVNTMPMIKEEPKQEGLSELEKLAIQKRRELGLKGTIDGFIAGYKLAQDNSYSEEEVYSIMRMCLGMKESGKTDIEIVEYFEQYKNK